MKYLLLSVATVLVLAAQNANADIAEEIKGRKVYTCAYMQDPPQSAKAWSISDMVKTGKNRESRFVEYNSEAAKNLWLDATTERTYEADPKLKGRETSFYMAYDVRGWHIYIESREPDTAKDGGKLEIFFAPGLNNVYYHQMMVSQPSDNGGFFDWGMPHRDYRSLKNYVTVDSKATDVGFGSYIFVPWEAVYDRLPLDNDYWRFSFMRWGTRVTWGGNVHDTGNFGLVQFEKPEQTVIEAIRVNMLKAAWEKFQETAKQAAKTWNDEKTGDRDFFTEKLQPEINVYMDFAKSLGDPATWNGETAAKAQGVLKEWMEFNYTVAALRTTFLMDKQFAE